MQEEQKGMAGKPPDMLVSERIVLRPWQVKDADWMYRWARDPEIGLLCGWKPHQSLEESRALCHHFSRATNLYAICLREQNGECIPIGSIGLHLHDGLKVDQDEVQKALSLSKKTLPAYSLGCWLARPYWRQGLMKEAASLLLRLAFETLELPRLYYCYYQGNDASRALQQSLGFHFLGQEKKRLPLLDGEERVSFVHVLEKEEWKKRQQAI